MNQTNFKSLLRHMVYAAVCLALCMVLPFLTGQIPQIGSALSPMHIPVLLAGFLCGPWWAMAVGFAAPMLRHVWMGMPPLITAIAMSFVLENLAQAIPAIGPDPKVPYTLFAKTYSIGGVAVSQATIITVLVSAAIMVALYLFTQKARIGCAMRCVSEDKEAATLMGINVNHTIIITFGIGAGLAAVAALMYIAQYPKVYTTMGATLGIYAFVAAVLGGIGSLPGAMLGGLMIGIVQSGANTYISSSMSDTFVYLILIVVLMFRPAGILGKNVGEKV